jgi:hypothetical protein
MFVKKLHVDETPPPEDQAQKIKPSQYITRLDAVAFDEFAKAVNAPGKDIPALQQAMKRAKKRFID